MVKLAAAIEGRVEYSKPKSSFPSAFLTPAATAEARKPWGQTMSSVLSFKVNADVLLIVEVIVDPAEGPRFVPLGKWGPTGGVVRTNEGPLPQKHGELAQSFDSLK